MRGLHKERWLVIIAVVALLCYYCCQQWPGLFLDFWNDELYTLEFFTLCSLSHTLTDYHVPNNHIFFNLLNNLYLKCLGISQWNLLLEAPAKLRCLPFFYGIATCWLTFRLTRITASAKAGIVAVVILITSIPFHHFVLQIRGYGLSMLLLMVVLNFLVDYRRTRRSKSWWGIIITAALLFYTIPSNIYYLLGTAGGLSIILIVHYRRRGVSIQQLWQQSWALQSLVALVFGIVIALLFYSPVFTEVFANEYVQAGSPFAWGKLRFLSWHTASSFLSSRWVLILAGVGFGWTYWKESCREPIIVVLFAIAIAPFLLVFLRGDSPPFRMFVVLMPVFAILIAISFWYLVDGVSARWQWLGIVVCIGYCILVFEEEKRNCAATILQNIKQGHRAQNLYHQYYSYHYQPRLDALAFRQTYDDLGAKPVVRWGCEPRGIINYLDDQGIELYPPEELDTLLLRYDTIYMITNKPAYFDDYKDVETQHLSKQYTYHNALLAYRRGIVETPPPLRDISILYSDSLSGEQQVKTLYSDQEFAANTELSVDEMTNGQRIHIGIDWYPLTPLHEVMLVCEVIRANGENTWLSTPLGQFRFPQQWHHLERAFVLDNQLVIGDILKVYLWNPNGAQAQYDKLRVRVLLQ